MAYVKQTWTNDDPETPLSAERLTHIEDGLEAAAAAADDVPTAAEVGAVPVTRTVAGKALSANITLATADIAGLAAALDAKGTSNLAIGTTESTAAAGNRGLSGTTAAQADSTAADVAGLVEDFNALLDKLRTRGVIS